jgi:hypothetical protein
MVYVVPTPQSSASSIQQESKQIWFSESDEQAQMKKNKLGIKDTKSKAR